MCGWGDAATLQQTRGGTYLDQLNLFENLEKSVAGKIWEEAARRFAGLAEGEVHAFVEEEGEGRNTSNTGVHPRADNKGHEDKRRGPGTRHLLKTSTHSEDRQASAGQEDDQDRGISPGRRPELHQWSAWRGSSKSVYEAHQPLELETGQSRHIADE